tara:strand:+ start:1892 stop:2212 length:321 start_codon:yes stop_codon:yes gene_type:complete
MTYKQAVNQFIKIGLATYLISPIIFFGSILIFSNEKSESNIYFFFVPLILGLGALWIPYALILGAITKLVNCINNKNSTKRLILLIINLIIQKIIYFFFNPYQFKY